MAELCYTPDELATMLKVTRQAVYNWIQQGHIAAVRIGRTVRVPAEEVERVLRDGRSPRQVDQGAAPHAGETASTSGDAGAPLPETGG